MTAQRNRAGFEDVVRLAAPDSRVECRLVGPTTIARILDEPPPHFIGVPAGTGFRKVRVCRARQLAESIGVGGRRGAQNLAGYGVGNAAHTLLHDSSLKSAHKRNCRCTISACGILFRVAAFEPSIPDENRTLRLRQSSCRRPNTSKFRRTNSSKRDLALLGYLSSPARTLIHGTRLESRRFYRKGRGLCLESRSLSMLDYAMAAPSGSEILR